MGVLQKEFCKNDEAGEKTAAFPSYRKPRPGTSTESRRGYIWKLGFARPADNFEHRGTRLTEQKDVVPVHALCPTALAMGMLAMLAVWTRGSVQGGLQNAKKPALPSWQGGLFRRERHCPINPP
ncbi:MAG: hypothetical protein EOL86_15010 [Deltaproteobacteria bacterium]|nr:hypothetical protein [Deltaproteobacteria bacterium]